jgi:putative DNA primase/helicase
MSAPGQAPPNAGLPQGVSFEDAQKIAQGDMGAIGVLVARLKLNRILPLQPEFIAFFAMLPEDDAWLVLRQAMIDAKIPIRDIDKKVKAKREENARPPPPDPSTIDAANSYGLFTMTKDGLFKAEKQAQIRVCIAFEVIGLMRRARDPDEPKAGSTGWGLLIRFRDSDGHDVSEFVEFAELHRKPSEVCATLAQVGMSIVPGRIEQQAFAEYLIKHPSKKRAQRLLQRGWAKVGKQLVYATRKAIFSREEPEEQISLSSKVDAVLRPHGKLEGWKNGLAKLAAPHRLARLAISTALTGSVLYLGGFETGGIHFGGMSGTGKTTITMFASSVDGDPANPGPCVMAWDGTFVGFEIGLFDRNDACAVIDEAGKANDFQIGEKIYLLAGGKGRERGNRDITLRETLMWRLSIVSTGEFLLENKMAEIEAAGKKRARGGQVSRILDIEARGVQTVETVLGASTDKDRQVEKRRKDPFDGENIDSAALVDAIKEQARDNYGVARPAFVQALLDHEVDYAFLRGRVAEFVTKYKPEKAHSQIQRAAERFGVISVAGELAIEYGVLPWKPGSSESAAAWAFKQWLNRRGSGPFEERQAIAAVRSMIERYGDSRFDPLVAGANVEPLQELDGHRAPVRYGYRMPGAWLVFPEVFRNDFCGGLDHLQVAETLHEHGMLERSKGTDNQAAAHQDAGRR